MSNVFNGASVINIPSGFKAGKLYSIVPNSGAGDLAVTRADANGSRVNPQGLIEFVGANVPRIDFLDGCPKLLVEPSRENLLTYSEQFDNAAWSKNNLTATANSNTSPDGANTAELLDEGTAASTFHWFYQGPTLNNSSTYTISVFFKYIDAQYVTINLFDGVDSSYVFYDLINGTKNTDPSNGTASIKDYGNGWYRCIYTRNTQSTGTPNFRIGFANSDGTSQVFTGTNRTVYAWGAQLEEGSYATSYIKTEATTQTRNADVISQTGLASLIGDSEGTLYVEGEVFDTSTDKSIATFSDGTISNRIVLAFRGSGSVGVFAAQGGVSQANMVGSPYLTNTIYKAAFAYALNDFTLYQDGIEVATDTSANTCADGVLTNFRLDYGTGGIQPFYGKISVLAWWQARLENDVLESLTSYETYEEMAATLDYTID